MELCLLIPMGIACGALIWPIGYMLRYKFSKNKLLHSHCGQWLNLVLTASALVGSSLAGNALSFSSNPLPILSVGCFWGLVIGWMYANTKITQRY